MANLSNTVGTIEFPEEMKNALPEIREWMESFTRTDLTEEEKRDILHFKYSWEYGIHSFQESAKSIAFPEEGPLCLHFYGTGRWSFYDCLNDGTGTITDRVKEDIALANAIARTKSRVEIEYYDEEAGQDRCENVTGACEAAFDASGTAHVSWHMTGRNDLSRTTDILATIFDYDANSTSSPEEMDEIYQSYMAGRKESGKKVENKLKKSQLKQVIDESKDMKGRVLIQDIDDPESFYEKLTKEPLYQELAKKPKTKDKHRR